jgi:DNA-directed RNA polymerase II subunit RPB1
MIKIFTKPLKKLGVKAKGKLDKVPTDPSQLVLKALGIPSLTEYNDDVECFYNDLNDEQIVFRIRLTKINKSKGNSQKVLDQEDNIYIIKSFQENLLNNIVLRGINGIEKVIPRKIQKQLIYNQDTGDYDKEDVCVLDTIGSNLESILGLDYIDTTKTYSNNVIEMKELLGIEAARSILLSEITGLFEEVGLNFRHLGLLCDVMTRGGRLMSIDRYGINKNDIGPLAKASFEETEKILLKAALFSEVDPVTGVSANIMTGQPIRGGTAFSQIMLDEAAMLRVQKGLPQSVVENEENDLTEEEINAMLHKGESNELCNDTALRANMIVPNVEQRNEEEELDMVLNVY